MEETGGRVLHPPAFAWRGVVIGIVRRQVDLRDGFRTAVNVDAFCPVDARPGWQGKPSVCRRMRCPFPLRDSVWKNAIRVFGVPGREEKQTNALDDGARLDGITMLKFSGTTGVVVVVDAFRDGVNVIANVVRSTT